MRSFLAAASLATLASLALALPAAAATGAMCSKSPAAKFQAKTVLEGKLKAEGVKVRQIKTEKGCYEVYGINKAGKKVNRAFNAETLEPVANPEAGEG